jgi:hypothetical protein
MLRQHPHISLVLESARRYRAKELSIEDLQRTLSAVMSALESDVPKSIHEALFEAEARVDSIRFTVGHADQPVAVARVLSDLESLIDNLSL